MDFLANENFPVNSIRLLRKVGHNVASIIEDTPGVKDYTILKRAYEEKRLILTFDRDYGELIINIDRSHQLVWYISALVHLHLKNLLKSY